MATRFALFLAGTTLIAPVQRLVQMTGASRAFLLPLLFHRMVLKVLRIRVEVSGAPVADGPVLVIANHISWLDIPVIGSICPLVFVAKKSVAGWPGFGWLATLQYTIFVDRDRRRSAGSDGAQIAERLALGDRVVLFAEGTSNDANRVLPFKSALVGAVLAGAGEVPVQPMTIVYTRRGGLPLNRAQRPSVAWYGDMPLIPHLLGVFAARPFDVSIVIGEPIDVAAAGGRKPVTEAAWREVAATAALVRNGLPAPARYSHDDANRLTKAQGSGFADGEKAVA